jgi:acetolactate synthase small subunit
MMAHENENDFRRGGVIMLLHTTDDMMDRVKDQLEKLIEVDKVVSYEGSAMYVDLSERVVDVD